MRKGARGISLIIGIILLLCSSDIRVSAESPPALLFKRAQQAKENNDLLRLTVFLFAYKETTEYAMADSAHRAGVDANFTAAWDRLYDTQRQLEECRKNLKLANAQAGLGSSTSGVTVPLPPMPEPAKKPPATRLPDTKLPAPNAPATQ